MSFLALAAQRIPIAPEGPGDSWATQSCLGAQHPVDFSARWVPLQEAWWFPEIPGWLVVGDPQIKTQNMSNEGPPRDIYLQLASTQLPDVWVPLQLSSLPPWVLSSSRRVQGGGTAAC